MATSTTPRVAPLPPSRRRRRTFPIVNARFQWKYTLLYVALGVGVAAVMGAFWYQARVANTRLLELAGNERLLHEVARGDRLFLVGMVAVVVMMALLLVGWGVVVTHRISGPLHIVARYLTVLAQGYFPDIRPLRKHDELQDFFATFEDAMRTMRARQKSSMRELDEAVAAAEKALDHGDASAALRSAIEALQNQREVIANGLSFSSDCGDDD